MGLIGELMALSGRHDEALRYAQRLSEQSAPLTSGTLVSDGVKHIRALVALDRGDEVAAMDLLENMQYNVNYLFVNHWGFYLREDARYRFAELLDRAGRQEDALRWFESVAEDGFLLVGPAFGRAAEILDRLGRTDEAIASYEEFLRIWANADPRFQPWLQEAAQRRDVLVGGVAREPAG
jgi:tetratricopeptide (TPR) repeat protein